MAELDAKLVVKGRDEISHANLAQRVFVSLVLKAAILLQLVPSVKTGDCYVLFPHLLT